MTDDQQLAARRRKRSRALYVIAAVVVAEMILASILVAAGVNLGPGEVIVLSLVSTLMGVLVARRPITRQPA